MLPELLSSLAEYRLLFVGALLLVVLWIAPEGVIGTLAASSAAPIRRPQRRTDFGLSPRSSRPTVARHDLVVRDIGISFGGIKAASDVSFIAQPWRASPA